MVEESVPFDITCLNPVINSTAPLTWLFTNDTSVSEEQKSELISQLITNEIGDDEFKNDFINLLNSNSEMQQALLHLEEWRKNIKNLAICIQNFSLDKYSNDIKKQAAKLISRIQYIINEAKESGAGCDFRMTLVSIK